MKKKLIAGMTSTALIASIGAPAFAANFSDVNGHWAASTINKLADAGIISGMDASTFAPEGTLTRAQFAKLITVALKLDTTSTTSSFSDVSGWAVGYVEAAKKAGIINGTDATHFDPNGTLTREAAAAIMVRALRTVGELQPGTTLNFPDAGQVSSWFKSDIEVAVANGLLNGKDGQLAPQGNATRAEAAVLTDRFLTKADELKASTGEFKVDSVSAINSKQLVIKFGQEVNPDSVLDADGLLLANVVSLDGVSLTGQEGSFDEKNQELTVTLATPLTKNTEYSVTVDNVLNPEADKFPKYSTAFKAIETVVPAIKSVTSVTKEDKTRNVTVEFTEPVQFNSIKVNGKFVSYVTADAGFGAKYTITTSEDLSSGQAYEVEINGLKDGFSNAAENILKTSVTVVRDTVKPNFTVTAVGEKTIDVAFDKTMSSSVAVDSFNVTYTDVLGNTKTAYQSGLAVLKSDKKTFRITLAAPVFDNATQASKEVSVTVKGVTDSILNAVDTKTSTVTIVRDTVKPTVKSVKVAPGTHNQVNVEFSEAVTGIALTDFALTDANGDTVKTAAGVPVAIASVGAADTNSDNKVSVTFDANLPTTGTYKLVLKQAQVSDTATVANTNDAQVVSFGYTKPVSSAPQLTATITNDIDGGLGSVESSSGTAADRKVVVNFTQADVVSGLSNSTGTYIEGAADNAANYTLNGLALPSGTVVTFANGGLYDLNGDLTVSEDLNGAASDLDAVVLDFSNVSSTNLPSVLKAGGDLAVSVANVKTAAGSTLAYTTASVPVKDTTAPTVSAAYLTGDVSSDTLKLTVSFSENVNIAAIAAAKFTLDGTGSTGAVTVVPTAANYVGTDKTKVEFTIAASTDLNVTQPVTLSVLAANGVTDEATAPNGLAATTTPIAVTNFATN